MLRNGRASLSEGGCDGSARLRALGVDEIVAVWKAGGPGQCLLSGRRLLRVLVADDDRDTADSLSMLLKLWGHDVREAYDGTTALEMALAFRPDVLLLDIAMPGIDGCRLAQELRRQPGFEGTLLIAVTGYGDRAHRLQWEADFDHYLVKPVEPDTVAGLLLAQRQRLAESSPAPFPTAWGRGRPSGDDGMPSLGLRRPGFAGWPMVKSQEALALSGVEREPGRVVPVGAGP